MRTGPGSTDIALTLATIERTQLADGCIPWFAGGHADPWNHIEAAMALSVGARYDSARRAFRWLAATQRRDGAWAASYRAGAPHDLTLDASFCAYVATGVWHHHLVTSSSSFLEEMWPVVTRAIDFALALQAPDGSIRWARDARYEPWPRALLTSSSSVLLSLSCALACARRLGVERPDWELSLFALAAAVGAGGEAFEPKERFAMDWYYPVLAGAVRGRAGIDRLRRRWDEFVEPGLGARCVSDRPWVTTGETCELVLALDAAGLAGHAEEMLGWVQHLRHDDGSYWTGATFPDGVRWPRERPTWGSAAAVLAWDAVTGATPASGLFRGEDRPALSPVLAAVGAGEDAQAAGRGLELEPAGRERAPVDRERRLTSL
ncbi:MAG: prenyltransferase [Actinomycetota bacterium]